MQNRIFLGHHYQQKKIPNTIRNILIKECITFKNLYSTFLQYMFIDNVNAIAMLARKYH